MKQTRSGITSPRLRAARRISRRWSASCKRCALSSADTILREGAKLLIATAAGLLKLRNRLTDKFEEDHKARAYLEAVL